MRAAGVPTARDDSPSRGRLRRQGGRARGGQGRLRLPHAGRSSTPALRAARGARRAARDRGAARGRGAVAVRARRRRATRSPLAGGAGLQARRRRRHRPEHRRHGRVLAGARTRRRSRSPSSWRRFTGRSSRSSRERGTPFIGCLYAGLMLTADGPRVLEFNCRFGDPGDAGDPAAARGRPPRALLGCGDGRARRASSWPCASARAVTVVLAAGDYPERGDTRLADRRGSTEAEAAGALVFHAGTALRDGQLVTNGGRILNVTASATTLGGARGARLRGGERDLVRGRALPARHRARSASGHVRS